MNDLSNLKHPLTTRTTIKVGLQKTGTLKRSYLIAAIFLSSSVYCANTTDIPGKLKGKIIGTTLGFDYVSGTASTTVNTAINVFDGNFNTFLASDQRTGGWAGLDLGTSCVITKISYCPRTDWSPRMVLGVFEGANQPDFGDAVTLFMVTQNPVQYAFTEQKVNCSKAFRYVRYVGPENVRSNVAEIAFYGYPSSGDPTRLVQLTNLPTVNIHTANAQDIINKETYLKGVISIVSENGTQFFSDSLEIRGRGNATWYHPKKPYRIKLFNKENILGMQACAKNWTLLPNWSDITLMRNLLAFDLSRRFEMPYTPSGKPVDLFLNGEFKGCYQLCDQVEVNPGRVEVDRMYPEDKSEPKVSGGYLIEIDAYAYSEKSWFESGRNKIPVTIKYPEKDEIVPEQRDYIESYFNQMERELYIDRENTLDKYIDTETFLRYFLINEITGNTDTFWSTNIYKKRGDEKFYFGPIWDLDLSYENDGRTYPINENPDWIYATTGSYANGARNLANRILSSEKMISRLHSLYATYRNQKAITDDSLLKVVDDYSDMLHESQRLNFMRWNLLNGNSYDNMVWLVKDYINKRIAWMDNKLAYIPESIPNQPVSRIAQWVEQENLHIEGLSDDAQVQVFDRIGRKVQEIQGCGNVVIHLDKGLHAIRIHDREAGVQSFKCIIR